MIYMVREPLLNLNNDQKISQRFTSAVNSPVPAVYEAVRSALGTVPVMSEKNDIIRD
jgi:hypothetical protein